MQNVQYGLAKIHFLICNLLTTYSKLVKRLVHLLLTFFPWPVIDKIVILFWCLTLFCLHGMYILNINSLYVIYMCLYYLVVDFLFIGSSLLAHLSWKRKYIDEIRKSSPEPLSQFQPNLAQSILRWRGFKFLQMKNQSILI